MKIFFIFSSEFYHSCRKITRSGNVFGVLRSFFKRSSSKKEFCVMANEVSIEFGKQPDFLGVNMKFFFCYFII